MSASEAIAEAGPAIPFVDPESLDPETRALHDRIGAAIGYVPNSMLTYLHRPAIAAAFLGLSSAIYGADDDSLPMAVQSKLGVICSSINGCAYCTSHQCNALQNPPSAAAAAGLSDSEVAELISGEAEGGDPVEQACFAYARAASFDPNSVSSEMLADLRKHLSPGQIVQLAAIVGMWKLFNTIHDSLHLPIEEQKVPYRRFFDAASLR
ncbi:MAG: carboxymuconolactone decarboxylase family protein [Novosphingobium sp.]|nr:carboxymuconolactone decarboxylase family protein [Novosphingobium sp.]MCP5401287.1 carboxymuconolactone decarboxylase family protein [Novosphingobium sp.]